MNNLLVSVITISYMDSIGLRKTIDSVKSQVGNFAIQHVVVDGGSPEVPAMLEERRNTVANFIGVSEPDNGRYDAMNKGIDLAHGDLMWFMHSGDVFSNPRSIATALSYLEDPIAQWGFGYARRVDQSGKFHGAFGHAPFSLKRFSLGGKSIPHQAAFFGRKVLEKVGKYDTEHGLAADQLYILKIAAMTSPVVVPEFLCDFDISGAGTGRPAWHHFKDMARARRKANLTFVNPVVDLGITAGLTGVMAAKDAISRRVR